LTKAINFNPLELAKISKPLRYTGGEPFQIKKDPRGLLSFCLAFPDIYEIGMSHTGYRILYTMLNRSPKISAERFFAPWSDAFEAGLAETVMVTLENRTPLRQCDMIGFSVQYELAYPALLYILKKAGIPLLSGERDTGFPIICAGGNPILNPAPLSAFIDVFFMGEMDGVLTGALEQVHTLKEKGAEKGEVLSMLDEYPFTYIPRLNPHKIVKKAIYMEFSENARADVLRPVIPIFPIIQDRVTVEIARGCTNGCRYCQAGIIYRPARERNVKDICSFAAEIISATGYEEVSLLSLDSGDYTHINELLDTLSAYFNPKKVSLSLPSLRAETVNPAVLEKAAGVRKGGFTIAPEAATQYLRDIINKNITEEEIINAALYAKRAGYNGVKLYFMCGLPFERDEDIAAIAELVAKIQAAVKGGRHFEITVSVSNFVPKPFTPFETFGQNSPEEFLRKHNILKASMRKVKAKLKLHDIFTSVIEAAISRGDESWHHTLYEGAERGFYLEAWGDFFSKEKWEKLFAETGFNPALLAERVYSDEERLIWDNTDVGVDKGWLKRERVLAAERKTSEDCRKSRCNACGVCDFKKVTNTYAEAGSPGTLHEQPSAWVYNKYLITYKRSGTAALLSALDASRIFAHLFIVGGAKIKYSEGFNPQPRIILLAPLPVGVEGEREVFLAEAADFPEGFLEAINKISVQGLEFLSIDRVAAFPHTADFEALYRFDGASFAFLLTKLKSGEARYDKLGKHGENKTVNLADYLINVEESGVKVKITALGGFHFPEFFRKAAYPSVPNIVRKELIYTQSAP
jgi:radical SAM family uncharacterized protein/radical SAM-linked protein